MTHSSMTGSSMTRSTLEQEYDIVVIGGGTAGPMAAIKAKAVSYTHLTLPTNREV